MRGLLFVLPVLIAACANGAREELPPPPLPARTGVDPIVAARAAGVEFHAVGPDFVLQFFRDDTITLTWNAGASTAAFPKPEPRYPRWDGEIYETQNETHRIRIEIRNYGCEGSAEGFDSSVLVIIGEAELHGCGRRL